ncbi:minor capsid protein [Mesorhizobium sp. M0955]|uniref:minor capsid protein n=1 Tax=Mesorhizobium sp. M0955 TaxID=2957033 RepID=UPI00333D06F0
MIWDIIRTKIEDAGLAVSGADMFEETMPADIKIGIMLRSPLSGIVVDPHIPGFHKPSMQVIVRHTDPVIGRRMALDLVDVLTVVGIEDYDATSARGAIRLSVFYPKTLPIQYPRLDGSCIEWSINFTTAFAVRK